TDLSFEHFDPELELGNLDANGRPIRPRKKPGRKPNPPSPAQRKAQNRAAQRAFRERKRREMREAESTVKHCIYARDQAVYEAKSLRKRVEELIYETNYLKGYVLNLKVACLSNGVDVPKFWDTGVTDEMGSDRLTFSQTTGIPQSLEFFLDRNMNIICADNQDEPSLISCPSPTSTYLVDDLHEPESPASSTSSIAHSPPFHLESPFFQRLLNTNLIHSETTLAEQEQSSNNVSMDTDMSDIPSSPETLVEDEPMIDLKTGLTRAVTEYDPASVKQEIQSEGKKVFPPMTPLDAIQRLRSEKNLDAEARTIFAPTELQRKIRHDTRIDVVPGAAMRDHMILFQDYYNANELFDYLTKNSVFLGGEVGNPDSWFVPPSFFKRYWFLCPNHKPERMDNAVEIMVDLGKSMAQVLSKRKEMYIQRDKYKNVFPEPTKKVEDLT
ncbi:hypothetical protein K501DRAFT_146722, partial [Backusella circina FSU 941]